MSQLSVMKALVLRAPRTFAVEDVPLGIPHEDPVLPMKRIVLDEIEIVGDRANPNTAGEALSLLVNGRVDLAPVLTHRFPLADFARALDTFEQRRDGAVKVAIKP